MSQALNSAQWRLQNVVSAIEELVIMDQAGVTEQQLEDVCCWTCDQVFNLQRLPTKVVISASSRYGPPSEHAWEYDTLTIIAQQAMMEGLDETSVSYIVDGAAELLARGEGDKVQAHVLAGIQERLSAAASTRGQAFVQRRAHGMRRLLELDTSKVRGIAYGHTSKAPPSIRTRILRTRHEDLAAFNLDYDAERVFAGDATALSRALEVIAIFRSLYAESKAKAAAAAAAAATAAAAAAAASAAATAAAAPAAPAARATSAPASSAPAAAAEDGGVGATIAAAASSLFAGIASVFGGSGAAPAPAAAAGSGTGAAMGGAAAGGSK